MTISVSRLLLVALGAVFSGYQLVLALSSLPVSTSRPMAVSAMVLYAVASAVALWVNSRRAARWVALMSLVVAIVLPIMVASQLPAGHPVGSDYSTWHVAAVGVLMVITSARGFHVLAWSGVMFLVVHTVVWVGPGALGSIGVIGSVLWVAVSHALQLWLAKAASDARIYAEAEREAAEWRTAQDAHMSERSIRVGLTARMALPLLRLIVSTGARLTDGQRRECLLLEAAIRDEIRGRALLDDRVREQVMAARRRGATVNLLDEGGLDSLGPQALERVHGEIARALRGSRADTIIVRTVAEESDAPDVAVTIVGLLDQDVNLLGDGDSDEATVETWVEISREAPATH